MKRTLIAAAALALATASGVAGAASWSVIVQPGVYGRVAIGGYAEAPLVYAPQPLVAIDNGYGQVVEEYVDPAYATDQTPVYLWVPEYQRLHWAEYCREYGAYGVPVYFVDDGWYRANVLRRAWTPEQRSWSPQQWAEQDRIARDRLERQRFEQQRYEQQQRWNQQRAWQEQQQARSDRDRADKDTQNRAAWGSPHGVVPQQGQGNAAGRAQSSGQWPPQGGQLSLHGGQPQLSGAQAQLSAGQSPQAVNGAGGRPAACQPGGAGVSGNAFAGQPPAASQPRGGARRGAGNRRGQDRADREDEGNARGGFERGREGGRER